MPLYDYKCVACGRKKEDVLLRGAEVNDDVLCGCGAVMSRIPSCPIPHIFPADGIFLEHVSAEGKRFYSKQEMKDYAAKHDLQLGALE